MSKPKYKITPSEYQSILSQLHLRRIDLFSARWSVNPEIDFNFQGVNLQIVHKNRGKIICPGPEKVVFSHAYTVCGDDESGKRFFDVSAEYRLSFESHIEISDDFFAVFKDMNLPINTWPYMRELLSSLAAKAGFGNLTLPFAILNR